MLPGSLSAGGTQVDPSDFKWTFPGSSGSASLSATVDSTLPASHMIQDGIFVTAIPFAGAHPGHAQTTNSIPAEAVALTLKIDTPGAYLVRVESRNTHSDHEHFAAIDLVVTNEKAPPR